MVNRNDVAKAAGVSGATVSRVFNNPDSVSQETRLKIMKVSEELNYHPNAIASNFVRRRSGNIGVIIPSIANIHIFSVHYFSEILSGIGAELAENNLDLLLLFHKPEDKAKNSYLKYFSSGKVDGCILLGTHKNDEGLKELQNKGLKFCLVNNNYSDADISFVDVDNVTGSYEAVKYLISLGHKAIAFLNGPMHFSNSVDRNEGFFKAMKESGIEVCKDFLLEGTYGKKSGYAAAAEIKAMLKRPTAVFCSNDRMAAGLMNGLREYGFRIPEDISIVGYDDSDIATIVEPQLTSVRIPFYELGRSCVKEFLGIINSEDTTNFKVFIKPELIKRQSTLKK